MVLGNCYILCGWKSNLSFETGYSCDETPVFLTLDSLFVILKWWMTTVYCNGVGTKETYLYYLPAFVEYLSQNPFEMALIDTFSLHEKYKPMPRVITRSSTTCY